MIKRGPKRQIISGGFLVSLRSNGTFYICDPCGFSHKKLFLSLSHGHIVTFLARGTLNFRSLSFIKRQRERERDRKSKKERGQYRIDYIHFLLLILQGIKRFLPQVPRPCVSCAQWQSRL